MISHISSRCSQQIGITPASNPSLTTTVPPRRTSRIAKRNVAGRAAALPVLQAPKRADRPQGQTMPSSCNDPEAKAEIRHALTIVSYVIPYYNEPISRDAKTNATCPVPVGGRTTNSLLHRRTDRRRLDRIGLSRVGKSRAGSDVDRQDSAFRVARRDDARRNTAPPKPRTPLSWRAMAAAVDAAL